MSTSHSATGKSLRSWTDEDLRVAVAEHHSWRAVARALGLRPTSTNNLRRHVARLCLDTSHFSGKRPWSDQQLRRVVAEAASWDDVLNRLEVKDTGTPRVRLKGHAFRLGLDTSHLDPPPARPEPSPLASIPPRLDLLRTAASAIATAWFSLRGYATAAAAEGQEYDLLVAFPAGIRRIQVKSSTHRNRNGRWRVGVGRRPYVLEGASVKAPYDPAKLDYFFIVTAAGTLYLVPSQAFGGRTGVYIDHYPEYCIGDVSSLLAWRQE